MSENKENNKHPSAHYEHGVPVIDVQSEAEREKSEAYASDKQHKDDLIALNRRLVNATVALVFATIALGIVTAVQLWYIHRQWKLNSDGLSKAGDQIWAAKDAAFAAQQAANTSKDILGENKRQFKETLDQITKQTDAQKEAANAATSAAHTAQAQLEVSQRAWMSITSVSVLSIRWNPYAGGWSFGIEPKIIYQNVGNIPAVRVRGASKVVFADQNPAVDFQTTIMQQQKDVCSRSTFAASGMEQIVFPGKNGSFSYGEGTAPQGSQIRAKDQLVSPVLIGCVFYEFSSSPVVHHTGFIFTLERKDQRPFVYGQPVNIDDLYFSDAWNGVSSIN